GALDARRVIGVNTNADLFGRGATIHDHGFDDSELPTFDDHVARGWRKRIKPEKLVTRQLMGAAGRPGLPTVMIEAYNVMQDRITRARLAGDPPDILITPRLAQVGLFDFHCAQAAINIGAAAAERSLQTINEAIETLG